MKKYLVATTALIGFATSACATYEDAAMAGAPAAATAQGQAAAVGEIDPAIWKLSDEDTTIYILGTYHMLPKDFAWRTDTIESALAASDEIYFEIEDDLRDPAAVMPTIQSMALDPANPPLAERIGADNAAKVVEITKGAGIPAQALDMMDTWFVGMTLANVMAQKFGATAESGVEIDLRKDVDARGLPVRGLESLAEQLGHFDGMSTEAQKNFVVEALADEDEMRTLFAGMTDAWVRGDIDGISTFFNEGAPIGSEMRAAMLTTRNADWTGDLAQRMGQPGTVFVAVGAGHLAGPDSVVAMLREKGYTVERIDD